MPAEVKIVTSDELFTGKDKVLQFTVVDADDAVVDITGWTLRWALSKAADHRSVAVSKTTSAGIALTDAANGVCQVTISAADTENLEGSDDPKWWHELSRTNSGNSDVLSYGSVVLRQSAT